MNDPVIISTIIAAMITLAGVFVPPLFSKRQNDASTMQMMQDMLNTAVKDIKELRKQIEEKDDPIRVTVDIEMTQPVPRVMGARVVKLPHITGRPLEQSAEK